MVDRAGQRRRGCPVVGAGGARGARRVPAVGSPPVTASSGRSCALASRARPTTHSSAPSSSAERSEPERTVRTRSTRTRRWLSDRLRRSRRCSSSSSARAGSTSRATSARASSAASGAGWRPSAASSFGDYLDYLEVHPDEYEQLFDTLLINVTEFFRDPPAWEHLRDDVAARSCWPPRRTDEPIRVWSAGCAIGPGGVHGRDGARRAARRRRLPRAREDLRHRHRRGRARPGAPGDLHRTRRLERVPEELRERYFERADQRSRSARTCAGR